MVSLAWIKGDANRWKQYVSNRVRFIQSRSLASEWNFVAGKENPADLCSRGLSATDLVKSDCVWWSGPIWLAGRRDLWPSEDPTSDAQAIVEEECKVTHSLPVLQNPPQVIFNIERYSILPRVLRLTAYILRAFRDVAAESLDIPNDFIDGFPTAEELARARDYWFRQLQAAAFPEELNRLREGRPVGRSSPLATLQPQLSADDGLIRLTGRTGRSNLLDDSPDVVILPNRLPGQGNQVPHFLLLLIRSAHIRLEHTGVRGTLAHLRETMWVIRGRQVVKRVLKCCVKCNMTQRRPYEQPVAPLPQDRCSRSLPFEATGIDYAGPLYLRGPSQKAWFLVFTCASTRAIHLEMVDSMSTPAFLMAFDRFVSRRGVCRVLYSDNAKTFHCADRQLRAYWFENRARLADRGIAWRFIAEAAPWWGGFWERMVSSVKRLLKTSIGNALLLPIELETVLIKIEAVLNSRPITFQSDDPREPKPISPSDLLIGRRLTTLPPAPPNAEPRNFNRQDATNRMRYLERLADDFWARWRSEYLRERSLHYERRRRTQPIRIGEVVLIQADNLKRQEWKLGVIAELYPSADGIVRSVRLRTTTGDLRRPVQRLCALELNEGDDDPFLYGPNEDDNGPLPPEREEQPHPAPPDHDPEVEMHPDPEGDDRPDQPRRDLPVDAPRMDDTERPAQPEEVPPAPPVEENPIWDLQNEPIEPNDGLLLQGGSVVDFLPPATRRGRAVRPPARFRDFVQ